MGQKARTVWNLLRSLKKRKGRSVELGWEIRVLFFTRSRRDGPWITAAGALENSVRDHRKKDFVFILNEVLTDAAFAGACYINREFARLS